MNTNGGYGRLSTRLAFAKPAVMLAICLVLGLPVSSWAAGKLSGDLQNLKAGTFLDVIIQFRASPSAADISTIRQQGGILKKAFANVPSALFNLPVSALEVRSPSQRK